MLDQMQPSDESRHRPLFSIVSYTANKKEMKRKQALLEKAAKLKPGSAKDKLVKAASEIDAGGSIFIHGRCALMSARGKHAIAKQNEEAVSRSQPKHYDNRTRNLQLLPSELPIKTHFDLITHFNSFRVIH